MKLVQRIFFIMLSMSYGVHADFIPSDLLDENLNNQSIYAAQGVTLGAGTDVGGNIQSVTSITIGVMSIVGGNIEAGTAAKTGADSRVGGNVSAGTSVTTGAKSNTGEDTPPGDGTFVVGNVFSGTSTTVGGDSTINGNIEAGETVTMGIAGKVSGIVTENLATDAGYSPPTVISQKAQLDRVQEELFRLGDNQGFKKLDITFGLKDETLTSGIYDSHNYLTIRAFKTLTLDGENKTGDFLFNVHNYLTFAADSKVKLINFKENSKVIWNVMGDVTGTVGYMATGARADVRGFIVANGYVKTGANSTIYGIGDTCGGAISVNDYVTFGADNTIGAPGCMPTLPTGPDYFSINHDTQGIHCAAEPVSITAKNADGSTTTDYTGTITLDTQTGTGGWSLDTGNGILVDDTADDGLATYTFDTADNGQASFELDYTEGAPTFNIDAYDATIRDDDAEGDMTFSASGFTIMASELNPLRLNDPILTQTAGIGFDIHITAYGTTADHPECGIIESYTNSKTLTLTTKYINPSRGTVLAIGGGTTAFNNGKAKITTQYQDVGMIRFGITDGTISGSSNDFVVKPDSYKVTLSDGYEATEVDGNWAKGNVYTQAGVNFNITVTAKGYGDVTTPNYGNENPPETVHLSHTLAQPEGGNNGIFNSDLSKTENGIYSGTANWSEVGIIDIIASVGDTDYLGTGDVSSTLVNVGRFTPAKLLIEVTDDGTFMSTNLNGPEDFTYVGQAFNYAIPPSFRVTAQNESSNTTLNYTGVWGKLSAGSIELKEPLSDSLQKGKDTSTLMDLTYLQHLNGFRDDDTPADPPKAVNGIFNVTLTDDVFTYVKDSNSEISPFNPSVNLVITRVVDLDGVSTEKLLTLNPTGTEEIRFGRMTMRGVNSTSQTELLMNYELQYLNDNGIFVLHDDQNSIVHNNDISGDPTGISVSNSRSTSTAGEFVFTLTRPADSTTKTYTMTTNLNDADLLWLQYDWEPDNDNDGKNFDDNPFANATFDNNSGEAKKVYIQQIIRQ